METPDRITAYKDQRNSSYGRNTAYLTPRQKRRVQHKQFSRKTHSHDSLVTVQEDGTVRRSSCQRCSPRPKPKPAVGGTR